MENDNENKPEATNIPVNDGDAAEQAQPEAPATDAAPEAPADEAAAPEAPAEPAAPAAGDDKKLTDVTVDGYTFQVDTDLLDDVATLELIDQIENQNKPAAILDFLKHLVGDDGYDKLKIYFTEKYGRFQISKLIAVYKAIFENFDPKDLL